MAPSQDSNSNNIENGVSFPSWIDKISLEKAVQESVGDFKSVISIKPEFYIAPGENYCSTLLRLTVEVELNDDNNKSISYVLKAQHSNPAVMEVFNQLEVFQKEKQVYHNILPKFEELYREVGKTVKFAPKAYKFDRDLGVDYVLLEDLKPFGYKNANRIAGLDMTHMKKALKKLAEFHAVSAVYVERFSMYNEDLTVGICNEANRPLLKEINKSTAFLDQLKKWKGSQSYYDKLADIDDFLVDQVLQNLQVNTTEFNVLNHGDCWTNNILFQYNAVGKIEDTLFVDFQMAKYGTPTLDLYYLILSSAAVDIKLSQFDYMIHHYYDNLVANLKLLQYQRPLPKLINLHTTLLKQGLAAYVVVSKILPVVMLEQNDHSETENYMQAESKRTLAMFTNPKYIQAMADILPWLDNRGLLDWK